MNPTVDAHIICLAILRGAQGLLLVREDAGVAQGMEQAGKVALELAITQFERVYEDQAKYKNFF